jgi:hypothetical protein
VTIVTSAVYPEFHNLAVSKKIAGDVDVFRRQTRTDVGLETWVLKGRENAPAMWDMYNEGLLYIGGCAPPTNYHVGNTSLTSYSFVPSDMAPSLDEDGTLLSHSLQQLVPQNGTDSEPRPSSPPSRSLIFHEGYGFRSASGGSTPPKAVRNIDTPLPDRNGLGWPGELVA